MTRRALLILSGLLLALAVPLAWLLTSEAGLVWAFNRVTSFLPGTTTVTTLEGRLLGPIHLTGLRYHDATTDDRIAELTLDWNPWGLLAGRLYITTVQAHGLHIASAASSGPGELPQIRLPVAVTVSNLEIDDITLASAGSTPVTVARLELSARTRGESVYVRRLMLRSDMLDLRVRGRVTPRGNYPLDIETRWTARVEDYPPLTGEGRFHGDLKRLRATQRLTAPLRVDLTANIISPLTTLRWDAALTVAALPLDKLRSDFPAVTLKGELKAHGDQTHLATEGTLAAIDHPGSDIRLKAQGDWSKATQPVRFDVDAQWRNIAELPIPGLALSSARGSLRAHGTVDAYALDVDADLMQPRAGPLHLTGDARGGRTALDIRQLQLTALGGTLRAHGGLDWAREFAWRVAFDGRKLDPGKLWPAWPGQLSIRGDSDGRLGKNLTANLAIAEASGTLRDQTFMLHAKAGVAGTNYRLDRFELRAGNAHLHASGHVADTWDFNWELQAPNLGQLLPEAAGSLKTRGRLSGARATPSVAATLDGKDLRYRNYHVTAIDTTFDVDLADARESRLTLAARDLGAFDTALSSLDIQATGRAAAHDIRVTLDGAHGELRLVAAGQYRDKQWRGALREATLSSSDLGDWTLVEATEMRVSRSQAALESSCWQWQDARFCGAAEWHASSGWQAQLSTTSLPTSVFAPAFSTDVTLEGTLDAQAQLRSRTTGEVHGVVTVHALPGSISIPGPGGRATELNYGASYLTARVADKRLDGTLRFQLADGSAIDASVSAPLRADESSGNQPVRGQLTARIRSLAAASVFFPQMEQPAGELSANLALAGTVDHPQLSGKLALQHGALDIGRAGIRLRDANLTATSTGGGAIDIKGEVTSGGGVLRLTGTGSVRQTGWRGSLRLQGDRFEAIKTPELWLRVSPDLTLDAQPGRVDLRGDLTIPEGRFAAKDISQAVTTSPDTVIVGETNEGAPERWNIYTRVRITLGNSVRVDAYNFRGRVTGTVIAVDEPQKTTVGTGELRFESATYDVYGTRLTIDSGSMLFTGGPIADPGLNARASRQVGDVLAGVQVAGTLRRPELTLFSQPPMNQADALSYLLLGKPASQAGSSDGAMLANAAGSLGLTGGELLAQRIGQAFGIEDVRVAPGTGNGTEGASLMLGTYLSPQLYVSYGIGLFTPANTLSLRYDISKHWQIQAQSGTATSTDVFYTIER